MMNFAGAVGPVAPLLEKTRQTDIAIQHLRRDIFMVIKWV